MLQRTIHKSQAKLKPHSLRPQAPYWVSFPVRVEFEVWRLFNSVWHLLFHWYTSTFVHLKTEFCVRLLQEHYRRTVQLGQAVGQLDETIRPDLSKWKGNDKWIKQQTTGEAFVNTFSKRNNWYTLNNISEVILEFDIFAIFWAITTWMPKFACLFIFNKFYLCVPKFRKSLWNFGIQICL